MYQVKADLTNEEEDRMRKIIAEKGIGKRSTILKRLLEKFIELVESNAQYMDAESTDLFGTEINWYEVDNIKNKP